MNIELFLLYDVVRESYFRLLTSSYGGTETVCFSYCADLPDLVAKILDSVDKVDTTSVGF